MWTAGDISWTDNQSTPRHTTPVIRALPPASPESPPSAWQREVKLRRSPPLPWIHPNLNWLLLKVVSSLVTSLLSSQSNEANLWPEQKTRFLNMKYDSCDWILFRAPQGECFSSLLHFLGFLNRQNVCRSLTHSEVVLAHRQHKTARQQGCGAGGHSRMWFPMLAWPHTAPEGAINPRVALSLICWVSAALAATRFWLSV